MSLVVVGNDLIKVIDKSGALWTGADEAHFTAKHIDKLRQFIDPSQANEPAHPADPRVAFGGPNGFAVWLSIPDHAAEFQQHETATAAANALLPV